MNTHCYTDSVIYQLNQQRGMMTYRDPLSNLFCVSFDNASIMGKFYTNIQNMGKGDIAVLMPKYVEPQTKYYSNRETGMPLLQPNYVIGDYVKSRSGDGYFIQDGKFFVNDIGPFGECTKTRPIKFLTPFEKASCGYKIVYSYY
jgi:hypothetical protein